MPACPRPPPLLIQPQEPAPVPLSPRLPPRPGSSRTDPLRAPWAFWASQLSLRPELSPSRRLRELLAQGPAELELTSKEALLSSPANSPSPSRQRREGAGRAREEQLQRRPSSSWEQEGPSSCGGAVGRDGRDQGCLSPPWSPGFLSPGPRILTDHGEAQGDILGAQRVLSPAGELPFLLCLYLMQLQDPRI